MFKKLISNLPFNPSLITEVSFYVKRLHREASLRRIGFGFMALTLMVQVFAVITPAEASNKCSSNDVIRCGFSSKNEAVQKCNANTQGFRSILNTFGVTCATLAKSNTITLNSNAYDNKLYSMGRNPYNKPGEFPMDFAGAGKFYFRPLSSWGNVNYKMLDMRTPDGAPFRIIYDCGNIVVERDYKPPSKPEPASKLKLAKTNSPKGTVKPGDTIEYTLAFSNKGGNAAYFSVNDILPKGLTYVSSSYGNWIFKKNGQHLKWYNNTPPYYTFGNTDVFGTPGVIKVKVKVDTNNPDGKVLCNDAWVEDVNTKTKKVQKWSKQSVCNTVQVTKKNKPQEKPCPEGTIKQPDGTCKKPEEPCPEGTIKQPDGTCKKPEEPEEKEAILAVEKKASNITQNISDANNTTAAAGDIIEYTLVTKNYGDGDAKNTILKPEELADILEYAELDFNSLNGAVFDQDTQTIAWNKPVTIKPDQSVTKTFRVRVKNPLPQTPTPTGNPGSFDLIMTNVYGNTINIKLPGGIVKTTEKTATQTLPNTGPGEALAVGSILTTIVGYFFARSRLMAKELELVKQEYSSGG